MLFSLSDPLARRGDGRSGALATGLSVLVHSGLVGMLVLTALWGSRPLIQPPHPIAVRMLETSSPVSPAPVPVAAPPKVTETPKVLPAKPQPAKPIAPSTTPAVPVTVSPPAPAEAGTDVPQALSQAPSAASPQADAQALVEARFDVAYLSNPRPIYPPAARRMGETGRVLLRVEVAEDGTPLQVLLKAGSGSPRLDQSALETVARWKFIPARRGDRPERSWVLVPVDFSLN